MINRKRIIALNIGALVVVNMPVGRGWPNILQGSLVIGYCYFAGYAWNKTRVCPVEIMARICISSWSRAFHLMYKEHAIRMQLIYFSLVGLMVAKLLCLVYWLA